MQRCILGQINKLNVVSFLWLRINLYIASIPTIVLPVPTQALTVINAWLSSDNVQVAPQEVEISSYLIGQIDAEINPDDLSGFEL